MNVLIIESAAKGKTLQKYLNKNWVVIATGGHVETLPDDRKKHGKQGGKPFWSNKPGQLPDPPWVWTERGESAVQAIIEAGGNAPVFWIATDPDREGEFIAWSLEKHLKPHGTTHRVSFQEVTKEALLRALESPAPVKQAMVNAALVRKFLDRLVGYRTSKLASSVVGQGASMGRVQTPALGFVVERELEREAFVPTPYFEVRAAVEGQRFDVLFHETGDTDVWRDEAGKSDRKRTFSNDDAKSAFNALSKANTVNLVSVKRGKSSERRSKPAFTTDTLLQEAGDKFGWSPGQTSALASVLYEKGHITYIRTDSTRLADSAVQALREAVADEYGDRELASAGPNKPEVSAAQDAHEAIRPTAVNVRIVDSGDEQADRLYRLIRARALATQMLPSVAESIAIEAECAGMKWLISTRIKWRSSLGWERAYAEFEPARPTSPPNLPIKTGEQWRIDAPTDQKPNPVLIEDETKPPSRYRPHRLVAKMKTEGIGRPSTYAKTLEKLSERKYVKVDGGALVPTPRGRAVWIDVAPLYAQSESDGVVKELFDTSYTAEMERGLDDIAHGLADCVQFWEIRRDQIRDLHNAALVRKKEGSATPKQRDQISRLLQNAGPEYVDINVEKLTFEQAKELIERMRDSGIKPVPTEKQLDYIRQLLAELATSKAEAASLVGIEDFSELTGGVDGTASALIEALLQKKEQLEEQDSPDQV